MAGRGFGKTWWGQKWIEALEAIDRDTNRLPRGRRYANNGSVLEIRVEGQTVVARVQGSRPTPYVIGIALERFTPLQTDRIASLVRDHPAIAADLLIGKLPEDFFRLLKDQGIALFPSGWSDIRSSCSCPDWANPCKHLAAVFYILANEIDKDPFLLFDLHGVSKSSLGSAAEIPSSTEESGDPGFLPWQDAPVHLPSNALPDLSLEPIDPDSLFTLLEDRPLFYPAGDFKILLRSAVRNVSNAVRQLAIQETLPPLDRVDFHLLVRPGEKAFFVFPPGLSPFGDSLPSRTKPLPALVGGSPRLVRKKGIELSPENVWDFFLETPLLTTAEHASDSVRALSLAASIALSFVRSGAWIPRVAQNGDGSFSVRYVPLVHAPKCREALEALARVLPPYLVYRDTDRTVCPGTGGAEFLVSSFLIRLVCRFSGVDIRDKLAESFFRGKPYSATRFEERQTGKSLEHWLEPVSMRTRDFSPVLRIDSRRSLFTLRIEVETRKDSTVPLQPLSGFLREADARDQRAMLKQIAVAAKHFPVLKEAADQKSAVSSAPVDSATLARFLTEGKNLFDLLGIRIVLPRSLASLVRPKIALKAAVRKENLSFLSLGDLLSFSWEIAVGNERITRKEFRALLEKAEGMVRFKNSYLLLDPDEAAGILRKLESPPPSLSAAETLRATLTGEADGVLFNPDRALQALADSLGTVDGIPLPSSLRATLRPYQERGFRWLATNLERGFGACLADDMGLGKTMQVLTLLLSLKESGTLSRPALVICPTTLIGNWRKEAERFAPSLSLRIHHGAERTPDPKGCDLVITSYGIVRREAALFCRQPWSVVVLDEAQAIKNPQTEQARIIRKLPAGKRIALSGTPVENRLTELWSLFDFLNRGYLGTLDTFRETFAIPIEKYAEPKPMETLRKAIAPFLLRRLKTDRAILPDLPEKQLFDEYCYLTREQAALYQEIVASSLREIEGSEGIARQGLLFRMITALKQISNHPAHYLKKGNPEPGRSGKAEKTLDLLDKILGSGEKALVFTQYREMGDLLETMIRDGLKISPLFFHGGLARTARDRMVDRFQEDSGPPILILSLKAGGTGLNLTRASNVIHYDLWWNPAVESQATDRAYRIGQSKNVTVHRLITLGTFEEKIDEMIRKKRDLADRVVASGERWITEMSNKELREIFTLQACD